MITLFRSNQTYALDELKRRLNDHIRQLTHTVSCVGTPPMILRYEFPCEPTDILTWLHNNQTDQIKVYWSDRQSPFEIGGIGSADQIKGDAVIDYNLLFEYIESRLSEDNKNLRYFGGLNFNTRAQTQWKDFGSYFFSVPQFELSRNGQQMTFAFNIAVKDIHPEFIDQTLNTLNFLDFSRTTIYRSVPVVLKRCDYPDYENWGKIFVRAMEDLKKRRYQKIVLARQSTFELDVPLRPIALLKHLRDMTPRCFHFCFQMSPHLGFLGATPERLFKRNGDHIESEALAGTAARGKNAQEDTQLANKLLGSFKNIREHQYVIDRIKSIFSKLCSDTHFDETQRLLKLDNGQHLITKCVGKLNPSISNEQILSLLHPTPAVAGFPTQEALTAISELEPFHRGWYAGPIGYIGHDTVEFAVAIRCGLVDQNQLSLYAGAGIVEGSQQDEEWEEIEGKISSFIKVFNK